MSVQRAQSYAHDFTADGRSWRDRSRAEALADAAMLREGVEELIRARVDMCRRNGMSWAEIAGALNVSRQAAQQRYGR